MARKSVSYRGLKPDNMRESVWNRIIEAWRNGLSDREAAFYASEISSTYIKESDIKQMIEDDPDIGMLRDNLVSGLLSKAKMNMAEALESGDMSATKWYLDRKGADEFSTKSAIAFEGAAIELSIEDKAKALDKLMEDFEANNE